MIKFSARIPGTTCAVTLEGNFDLTAAIKFWAERGFTELLVPKPAAGPTEALTKET